MLREILSLQLIKIISTSNDEEEQEDPSDEEMHDRDDDDDDDDDDHHDDVEGNNNGLPSLNEAVTAKNDAKDYTTTNSKDTISDVPTSPSCLVLPSSLISPSSPADAVKSKALESTNAAVKDAISDSTDLKSSLILSSSPTSPSSLVPISTPFDQTQEISSVEVVEVQPGPLKKIQRYLDLINN